MAGAFNIIARDFLGFKNAAREVPWQQLRCGHAQAPIRTKIGERYEPATANRYLSAAGQGRATRRLALLLTARKRVPTGTRGTHRAGTSKD
jgi:hypothetical protein